MTPEEFDQLPEDDPLAAFEAAPEEKPTPAQEEPSTAFKVTDAALNNPVTRGAIQGASYGFEDEAEGLMGAAREGADMLGRKLGISEPLTEQEDAFAGTNPAAGAGVGTRLLDAYRRERDAAREEQRASRDSSPKLALAGEMAGAVLAPGPKGQAAKGVTARAAQMALQGAKVGGLYGAGASEADLTKGEIIPFLRDVGAGSALGGVGGAVFGAGMAKLQPFLAKLAQKRAIQALRPSEAALKTLEKSSPRGDPTQAARQIGQRALDEGVVVPFGTAEGAAKRVASKLDETGELQGAMLQAIADQAPQARISMPAVASKLEDAAARAKLSTATAPMAGHLANQSKVARNVALERLKQLGPERDYLTLLEAEAEKRALQDKVREAGGYALARGSPATKAKEQAASIWRQAVEDEAEKHVGPEMAGQWQTLKKRFGDLSEIGKLSRTGATKELASRADLGRSELADAIAQRTSGHGGPQHGIVNYLTSHAWDAARNAFMERRPATMAHLYRTLSGAPTSLDGLLPSQMSLLRAGEESALDPYLEALREKARQP